MTQILSATDATSDTFESQGSRFWLFIDDHAGGTWKLQANRADLGAVIGQLDGDLTDAATTLNLAEDAAVTVAANDHLRVGAEILKVTAVTDQSTFTVVRAQLGTSATEHDDGASVSEAEEWLDVNGASYDSGGVWSIDTTPAGVGLRLTGGSQGARAWIEGPT